MSLPASTASPGPSRVAGQFHATEDIDVYRVELVAGQRYFFDLQSAGPISLDLLGEDGAVLASGSVHIVGGGTSNQWVASLSFVATHSGTHALRAGTSSLWQTAAPREQAYLLSAGRIEPDAEPDAAAQALPIRPGERHTGRLDVAQDIDSHVLTLAAGQRVEVSSAGPDVALRIIDPLGRVRTLDDPWGSPSFLICADIAGDYRIERRYLSADNYPGGYGGVAYAIAADTVAPDDHADVRTGATVLTGGLPANGTVQLAGDRDWFRFDAQAGQRYRIELASDAMAAGHFVLSLVDGSGQLLRQATGGQALLFTAPGAGAYSVRVESDDNLYYWFEPMAYRLQAQAVAADDHADDRTGATPLAVGASAGFRFDGTNDVDVFRFDAVAGQRYQVRLTDASGAGFQPIDAFFVEAGEAVPADPGWPPRYGSEQAPTDWYFTAAASAPVHLALMSRWPLDATFRVELKPVAADDHAESAAAATMLSLGTVLTGMLSGPGDADLFAVRLVAGERYRIEFTAPTGANGVSWAAGFSPLLEVAASGATAPLATLTGSHGDTIYSMVLVAPQDGLYVLQPRYAEAYAVRVGIAAPHAGDEADSAASASWLDASGPYAATGLTLTGTDGGDHLAGGSRSDTLSGGGGDDGIDGDDGDDTLDGGAGNDTLYGRRGRDLIEGGSGDDELRGGDHADTLRGGDGRDRLHGDDGDDRLEGGAGPDRLHADRGNDLVDGGDGIDVMQLAGARSTFTLTRSAAGWTLRDDVNGNGSDTLVAVERLAFGDMDLALDLDGHAGSVARILGALLGPRTVADRSLAGLGLSLLDGGMSYADLVGAAVASELFWQQAGGARSNAAFVDIVYRHVVGEAPAAAERAYFVGLLDGGQFTQAGLALLACDTALNAENIDLTGLQSTGLAYLPAG